MKRILTFCFFLSCITVCAQDPEFTQYSSAALYLNPGLAGANGCGKAAAGYRNQWPALSGSFQTFYAGYDHYIHPMRGGLGLYHMHDRAGGATLINDRTALSYAAHIQLFEGRLIVRPAVEVAYIRKTVNWEKLTFGDMIDPRRGFVYTSAEQQQKQLKRHNIDATSGVFIYAEHVFAGFAVHHLSEPDEGFLGTSKLPRKYTAHAGAVIALDSASSFTFYPQLLYQRQQDFQQMQAGVQMKYKRFLCGLGYRVKDAAILQLGFQVPLFKISYSYDHTISSLSNLTGGSHELMLSFNILHRKEKKIKAFSELPF